MKVLIVDDEQLELDIIEHSINWKLLGIEQVLKATNGKRAFHIIQNEMPDIVITDIRMPIMDGLALARRILAEKLPIKIIFLTGYDNFSYIKAGFRLEAVDYILKPVIPLQINDVVRRTIELVKRETLIRQSLELSNQMMMEKIIFGDNCEEFMSRFDDKRYHLLQVYAGWNQLFYKSIYQENPPIKYGVYQKDCCTFLVSSGENLKRLTEKIFSRAKTECGGEASVVYSGLTFDVHRVHEGYQMCRSYVNKIYCQEVWLNLEVMEECGDCIASYEECEKTEAVENLKTLLPKENLNKISEAIEAAFVYIRNASLRKEEVIRFQTDILLEVDKHFVAGNEAIQVFLAIQVEDAIKKIENTIHIQQAENIFKKYMIQIYSYFQVQEQGKYAYIVLRVKEYVEKHYQDAINMEELSGELSLSVNYVRSIFKEQTGQTILGYITDYRFSAGRMLLKNKGLKIGEVSRQIGYDNVSYFCSVFTKRYGMSPGDYRNTF